MYGHYEQPGIADQQTVPGTADAAYGGSSGSGSRSKKGKGQIFEDILQLGNKG
jgi:hypothetical protein